MSFERELEDELLKEGRVHVGLLVLLKQLAIGSQTGSEDDSLLKPSKTLMILAEVEQTSVLIQPLEVLSETASAHVIINGKNKIYTSRPVD